MNLLNDISDFIFIQTPLQKSDIIFIPGSICPDLAVKGASLYTHKYAPLILPSGRYSIKASKFVLPKKYASSYNNTYDTEYDFLKDILIKNNVPEDKILKENMASNTYENSLYSCAAADKHNLNIKKAIIVCKSYHARRCFMYYSLAFPETEFFICAVDYDNITKTTWFKSENGINTVLGELERCGLQFKNILKDNL